MTPKMSKLDEEINREIRRREAVTLSWPDPEKEAKRTQAVFAEGCEIPDCEACRATAKEFFSRFAAELLEAAALAVPRPGGLHEKGNKQCPRCILQEAAEAYRAGRKP